MESAVSQLYGAGEQGETDECCAHCGDWVSRQDDVYLAEIYRCDKSNPDRLILCTTTRGEYEFTRYFLHEACWREIESDLEGQIQEAKTPPIRMPPEERVCACTLCNNMLRDGDPVILLTPGEIRKSKKSGDTFEQHAGPHMLCPQCVLTVQEETFPDWDELTDFWHTALLAEADWAPDEEELGD